MPATFLVERLEELHDQWTNDPEKAHLARDLEEWVERHATDDDAGAG